MKHIILTLLILSTAYVCLAQTDVGVLYGVRSDISNLLYTENGNALFIQSSTLPVGRRMSLTRGIFVQKKMRYLFSRSEMTYSQNEQRYRLTPLPAYDLPFESISNKYKQIDLALMAGITKYNTRFGVGTVAHVFMRTETDLDRIAAHTRSLGGTSIGFLSSVGIDSGKVHLDMRYENIFRTVGDHIYSGDHMKSIRNKAHTIHMVIAVTI